MKSIDKSLDEAQTGVEEQLAEIVADLVSAKDDAAFFKMLFSAAPGQWLPVVTLCSDQTGLQSHLNQLESAIKGKLEVTWLDYSESAYGQGQCTIMFFLETFLWSSVALYNKGRYDRAKPAL